MTAKIIKLEDYRKGVRDKKCGIIFPQVYRLRSFYWDISDDQSTVIPSNRPAPIYYTLSDSETLGLANCTWDPIDILDPNIDDCWLMIRYHAKKEFLHGYLDALDDHIMEDSPGRAHVYQTEQGLFTILLRQAIFGRPNNIMVYVSIGEDPTANHPLWGHLSPGYMNHYHIVYADGKTTDDPDEIWPPEEDD